MRSSRFRTCVIVLLLFVLMVPAVSAQEYTVRSGYDSPVPPGADSRVPEPVPFWSLPLWLILTQLALLPPEILLAVKLWATLGFRQVSGANVLDQELRARIYEYIRSNPGVHLRGISSGLSVRMGTLRYHLGVLRHTHKIAVCQNQATVRFFENSGTYSAEEQQIHKHLRNENTKKILALLLAQPSSTRQDIAHSVGISGPSVSWHMKRLEEDKIIIHRRDGRVVSYEIPAAVAGYLGRYVQASTDAAPQECRGIAGQV